MPKLTIQEANERWAKRQNKPQPNEHPWKTSFINNAKEKDTAKKIKKK